MAALRAPVFSGSFTGKTGSAWLYSKRLLICASTCLIVCLCLPKHITLPNARLPVCQCQPCDLCAFTIFTRPQNVCPASLYRHLLPYNICLFLQKFLHVYLQKLRKHRKLFYFFTMYNICSLFHQTQFTCSWIMLFQDCSSVYFIKGGQFANKFRKLQIDKFVDYIRSNFLK